MLNFRLGAGMKPHGWQVLVLSLVFVVLLVGAVSCSKNAGEAQGQWVAILHTNDIHGHFEATPASWIDGNPPIGGFPAASFYVAREREKAERSLLLDAGDFMTGTPICDMDHEGVLGGGMMVFLNLLGYDAVCLGNHDFDHKRDVTSALVALAEMPVLCANVFNESGQLFTGKAYEIFEVGGVRVGVIGLIMENLPGYLVPGAIEGLRVGQSLASINSVLDEIDPKTDLIVLLTHVGVDIDEALAEQLAPRVDVIVGGHSHSRIEEPEVRHGIIIVQAGSNNRYLGKLEVLVHGDGVTDHRGRLIPMWVADAESKENVRQLAAQFEQRIDDLYGKVIGELKTDWFTSSREESNTGSWIADRMREAAGADIAVINSGGIRKHLPRGFIKVLDIKEMLPFDNALMTFECTGDEVLRIAERNAGAAAEGGGVLQISGLRYRWRRAPAGGAIAERVEVGGRPVERDRIYLVAAPDYVIGNSTRYFGFEPPNASPLGTVLTDVIIEAVREAAVIESEVDGRMEEVR